MLREIGEIRTAIAPAQWISLKSDRLPALRFLERRRGRLTEVAAQVE